MSSRAAAAAEALPPTARAIALILASTPTVQDAQPGVLHQLLELSHRYTSQVLSDALVYAEHAGRSGKIEQDDVVLAVQARVGWEFGGRVPHEYLQTLATQTNSVPLPSVPEVFGVRLPPPSECLTSIDFDLIPNQPPPTVKVFDEEIEEVEETDSEEEDEDMEPAAIPPSANASQDFASQGYLSHLPNTVQTPTDADVMTPTVGPSQMQEEASEEEEEDGLFAGADEDEESAPEDHAEDAGNAAGTSEDAAPNGLKRKLVEEDDYD